MKPPVHGPKPSQEFKHKKALGNLQRAWREAESRGASDAERMKSASPAEDMDAPLETHLALEINGVLFKVYSLTLPPKMDSSAAVDARSYRERIKTAFTARPLLKVTNAFWCPVKLQGVSTSPVIPGMAANLRRWTSSPSSTPWTAPGSSSSPG